VAGLIGCIGGASDYIPRTFRRGAARLGMSTQEILMFVTPAYAQGAGGGPDMLISILPFVLIFVIMYFLIIRPQRQQLKKRQEMLGAIRRGDSVVTGGGLLGKVTKVINDNELEVDLGGGLKVTALRSMIAEVRVKGEPVANQNAQK
jgi:preprotein translocase subunit YajC